MSTLPEVLQVKEVSEGRWLAPHPDKDPEGRDVIFSGQLLAQMIMVSAAASADGMKTKSIHAIFARAGRYSAGQVEMLRESMHSGRAWASDTVTANQGDRLLARGLVLLNTAEPDLMRHAPAMPDVPGPDQCSHRTFGVVYPDTDVRLVESAPARETPTMQMWIRVRESYDTVAVNQALIAWSQPGFIIGTAMIAHRDQVDQAQAHRSISTGVISHTSHFHDDVDAGQWLLYTHEGSYAGNGRIFGQGSVFDQNGMLVASFSQDSMARRTEQPLDFKTGL